MDEQAPRCWLHAFDSRADSASKRAPRSGDLSARSRSLGRRLRRRPRRAYRRNHLVPIQLRRTFELANTASNGSRVGHSAVRGSGRENRTPASSSLRSETRRHGPTGRCPLGTSVTKPACHHGRCSIASMTGTPSRAGGLTHQHFKSWSSRAFRRSMRLHPCQMRVSAKRRSP